MLQPQSLQQATVYLYNSILNLVHSFVRQNCANPQAAEIYCQNLRRGDSVETVNLYRALEAAIQNRQIIEYGNGQVDDNSVIRAIRATIDRDVYEIIQALSRQTQMLHHGAGLPSGGIGLGASTGNVANIYGSGRPANNPPPPPPPQPFSTRPADVPPQQQQPVPQPYAASVHIDLTLDVESYSDAAHGLLPHITSRAMGEKTIIARHKAAEFGNKKKVETSHLENFFLGNVFDRYEFNCFNGQIGPFVADELSRFSPHLCKHHLKTLAPVSRSDQDAPLIGVGTISMVPAFRNIDECCEVLLPAFRELQHTPFFCTVSYDEVTTLPLDENVVNQLTNDLLSPYTIVKTDDSSLSEDIRTIAMSSHSDDLQNHYIYKQYCELLLAKYMILFKESIAGFDVKVTDMMNRWLQFTMMSAGNHNQTLSVSSIQDALTTDVDRFITSMRIGSPVTANVIKTQYYKQLLMALWNHGLVPGNKQVIRAMDDDGSIKKVLDGRLLASLTASLSTSKENTPFLSGLLNLGQDGRDALLLKYASKYTTVGVKKTFILTNLLSDETISHVSSKKTSTTYTQDRLVGNGLFDQLLCLKQHQDGVFESQYVVTLQDDYTVFDFGLFGDLTGAGIRTRTTSFLCDDE